MLIARWERAFATCFECIHWKPKAQEYVILSLTFPCAAPSAVVLYIFSVLHFS